jgi:hypothetical protein
MTGGEVAARPNRGGDGSDDGWELRLERRYSRLLTVLPKPYREARGAEMLGALMDGAPEGRRWPKVGEALSLVGHGLKVRSGVHAESPSKESATSSARALALAGTLLAMFNASLSSVWRLPRWGIYGTDVNWSDLDGHHHSYVEALLFQATGLLWLAGYLALVLGMQKTTRTLGVLLSGVAVFAVSGVYTLFAALPPLITALAMIVAAARGLPKARYPAWWFAMLAPIGAAFLYLNLDSGTWLWPGRVGTVGPLILVAVATAVVTATQARRSPAWPLAFAVVAAMAIGQHLLEWNHYPMAPSVVDPVLVGLFFLEGVLISIAGYAVLRERRTLASDAPST